MKTDIVIIGAGLTGLTTAYLLARKGRELMVVEQMDKVFGICCSGIGCLLFSSSARWICPENPRQN